MSPEAGLLALGGTFAGAIGLVVGSFLDLCITRLPEDRSVVWPGSRCDGCGHAIRPRDNVPVLSWLILRGRCRDCGARIGPRTPLIEALAGLLGVLLFRRFVTDVSDLDAAHFALWSTGLVFCGALVVAAYTDLRQRIIPDETSIYAAPLGIGAAALLTALGVDDPIVIGPGEAVLSAAGVGASFAALALGARWVLGHDGLGWGDIKLVTMIAAFFGAIPAALVVLLVASVAASVHGVVHVLITRRRAYLPFGPVLAWSGITYVLFGEGMVRTLFPGASILLGR